MIKDNEALLLLRSEFPELKINRFADCTEKEIYQNARLLADLACSHIKQNDLILPGRIFKIAERLFQEGSQTCKTAIDNVFLFSISTRMGHPALMDSLLTAHLKEEYHRQLYCPGI